MVRKLDELYQYAAKLFPFEQSRMKVQVTNSIHDQNSKEFGLHKLEKSQARCLYCDSLCGKEKLKLLNSI